MSWSITKVDGGHWVARELNQVLARITLKNGGTCEVTFTRAPAFDYEFSMANKPGSDELRLERAIGYVRGVERAGRGRARGQCARDREGVMGTTIAARPFRPFPTAAAAQLAGFTVDRHCYPWLAYKGPRFRPDEAHDVDTDDEAMMRGVAGGAMDVIHTVVETRVLDSESRQFLRQAVRRMRDTLDREPSIVDHFPGRKP